ncbi:type IX secretion system membrane protein PorP/SprF [Parabacteroides faecis]|uniref:PorP/SprF family type IX secretion system membrane protein n=1 Tax=Parabacteroides TaxID=375288 RepID=UPI000EFEB76A|nr:MULTISPECIES: type IX secretion system membrane protein PorP/SprF [Parabacteroides]MBC8618793.1 type IX secretion system membrane protein PorP/SprF [Parabacteroides faecis]RHR98566.1 type IX secretion system membrane protein PorP/SprF [Parabacteroides sp. AF14-59]
MKRVFLFIIALITCTMSVRAQSDMQLSQYFLGMGYYNPAYAGTTGDLNMLGLFRQQWIGIPNAGTSFFVIADMPLKLGSLNNGIGLVANTESIGLFQFTKVAFQYAYKQKLFGGTLSIGLQGGIYNVGFDGTKIHIPESPDHTPVESDPALPSTSVQAMALDVNAGIYYTHKNFYAGFGATHLTAPEMALGETTNYYIPMGLNLTGGYNIQLRNPLYELQPSVFLKTDMQTFQADITARMVYNKMFNGGLSWRINESVVVLLGATFGRLQVGYAYDFPTTAMLKGSSGSHEVLVRYQLKLKKTKTGKNRHKSVRIL